VATFWSPVVLSRFLKDKGFEEQFNQEPNDELVFKTVYSVLKSSLIKSQMTDIYSDRQ